MDQSQHNQPNNTSTQDYIPPGEQPPYSTYAQNLSSPLSVGQYILIFIIMAIPIVNIVMLFVWAFGDNNINKRNYARAVLILALICIALTITMSILFRSIISTLLYFINFIPSVF